jgi:hypothetical protein
MADQTTMAADQTTMALNGRQKLPTGKKLPSRF